MAIICETECGVALAQGVLVGLRESRGGIMTSNHNDDVIDCELELWSDY